MSSKGYRGTISISAKISKESRHSEICDSTKFSLVEMHELMNLRVASSGQSLPDYLTERGFTGTFMEQLEKIGAIEVEKDEEISKRPTMKERKVYIQGRPRSMPRLYHKEDALAGVPWSDRATNRLQNAAALLPTLPV